MTKTYPPIVKRVYDVLGRGTVTHHPATESNKLGQSGVHTFVNDIMDIMASCQNEQTAYKALHQYLIDGSKSI